MGLVADECESEGEFVPEGEEVEDDDGGECRLGEGEGDVDKDAPRGAAVNSCGIFELARDGCKCAAEDEDADGQGEANVGAEEGEDGVFEVEAVMSQEAVEGDEGDVDWDHHAGEEEEEEDFAAVESHAGEGVGCERRGGDCEDDGPAGDCKAVEICPPKLAGAHDHAEVLRGGTRGQGKGRVSYFVVVPQCAESHPDNRIAEGDEECDEDEVSRDGGGGDAAEAHGVGLRAVFMAPAAAMKAMMKSATATAEP